MMSALLIAAGLYTGLAALVYFFQDRMVYVPYRELEGTPADGRLEYREVSFTSADGVRLSGWLVPAPGARGTVLFCHGNAGNISHLLGVVRIFHELGLNALVFDYRGYGQSQGKPTEEGTYLDAEAAWNFLVSQEGIAPREIIVCGRSLGGPIAAWLAQKHRPAALFLEETFTSLPELGQRLYPIFPARWLARYQYNTLAYVSRVQCPVLVVHSPDDRLVPLAHGRRLYQAAPQPKEFLEIEGGHGEGFAVSEKRYQAGVAAFISQFLKSGS
jgi:fermentation-respiration switch protein FrsA (DUF1100 family)